MYRPDDEYIKNLLESLGLVVRKKHIFLADCYPEQGIEVYFTVYVVQKKYSRI